MSAPAPAPTTPSLDASLREQIANNATTLVAFAGIAVILLVVLVMVARSMSRVISRWREESTAAAVPPPHASSDDQEDDDADDGAATDDHAPLPPAVSAADAAAAVGSTAALRARGRQLEKKYAAYNAALDAHLQQRGATGRAPRDRMDARVFGGGDVWAYPTGG